MKYLPLCCLVRALITHTRVHRDTWTCVTQGINNATTVFPTSYVVEVISYAAIITRKSPDVFTYVTWKVNVSDRKKEIFIPEKFYARA